MRLSALLPLFVNGVTALLLSQPVMAQPNADKAPMHVVMVSPRGETSMEREFKSELQQRHAGPVKFSFIKPDTTNDQEMNGLPARIRAMKPDLIYTWGTPTTLAVAGTEDKPVIKDIPVFFTVVAYPARVGITKSLAKPRPMLSGTSHLVPLQIQIDTMVKLQPFTKLGVVFNSDEPQTKFMLADLQETAKTLNIQLVIEDVVDPTTGDPNPDNIPKKVKAVKEKGAQWLYVGPDTFVGFTHRDLTTKSAIEYGLPSFTPNQSAIKDSFATLGVFSPLDDMGRFNAFKALQLIKTKGAERVSVDTLQKFTVMVNTCATKTLKLPVTPYIKTMAEQLTPENGGCKMP